MPTVVGVKFRTSAKVYYFSPGDATHLEPGDWVIVETARGQEAGTVAFVPREVTEDEIPGTLKSILRPATALDLTQMERYQQREKQALHTCRAEVAASGLPMKVIRAEYNFSGTHLTFYFTAEKRVDFRSLVKDLARHFRTRIELRQIGVRDEVKLIGGYGLCGRPHCCATWLPDFRPISIRMAKQQDLPLSPMEISGVCGRLLCCLAYENDYYAEVKKRLPRVGRTIDTPHGEGKVIGVNVVREDITVLLGGDTTVTIPASELESLPQQADRPPQREAGRRQRH
ncbi:MAG: stage 0 sporulation family protein [Anaerolineae bacterium]|nr:stage 0 sporulation family protein [Anaerolineae bacterium]